LLTGPAQPGTLSPGILRLGIGSCEKNGPDQPREAHMSYDLHITRAGDWIDADQHSITRAEWERFAESHPELIRDGEVSWEDIGMQPVYSFTLPDGSQAWLSWRDEHVHVNGRFQDVAAIAALAAQLHARLVGDDNEEYHPDGSSSDWTEDREPIAPPAS
jgi:hypothetical protein